MCSGDHSAIYRYTPRSNVSEGQVDDLLVTLPDYAAGFTQSPCIPDNPQLDGFTRLERPEIHENSEKYPDELQGKQCCKNEEQTVDRNHAKSTGRDSNAREQHVEEVFVCYDDDRNLRAFYHPQLDYIENSGVWLRPLIDPMVDHEAFAAIVEPIMRCSFMEPRLQYVHRTDTVRAGLATQSLHFWSTNVVALRDDSRPCKDRIGVQNVREHPDQPHDYHRDEITELVSEWHQVSPRRYWKMNLLVPAGGIPILTSSYGALHAWAWNEHFPTPVCHFCCIHCFSSRVLQM